MNAIVAVNDDWGIGFKGRLLVRNKADMHRFVQLTMGGTVLMGRATFESFPGGALKGRRNVVLTHNLDFAASNVEVVHSIGEALDAVGIAPTSKQPSMEATAAQKPIPSAQNPITAAQNPIVPETNDVWVIGGERVYRELLPYCSRVYVTKNHTTAPADAFFPDLDEDSAWTVVSSESGGITKSDIAFDFVTYAHV